MAEENRYDKGVMSICEDKVEVAVLALSEGNLDRGHVFHHETMCFSNCGLVWFPLMLFEGQDRKSLMMYLNNMSDRISPVAMTTEVTKLS